MNAACPAPVAESLQAFKGLVFFRMRSIKMPTRKFRWKDAETKEVIERVVEAHTATGQIIARMRKGHERPIWGAEA